MNFELFCKQKLNYHYSIRKKTMYSFFSFVRKLPFLVFLMWKCSIKENRKNVWNNKYSNDCFNLETILFFFAKSRYGTFFLFYYCYGKILICENTRFLIIKKTASTTGNCKPCVFYFIFVIFIETDLKIFAVFSFKGLKNLYQSLQTLK